MIVKRTIPGFTWFRGSKEWRKKFKVELADGTEYNPSIAKIRIDRIKKRK